MPFFNVLSERIDAAVPSRAKPKAAPPMPKQAPVARHDPLKGPSKNPAVMAAVEAARKRSEAFLKTKKR